MAGKIPRAKENDYTAEMAAARRQFIEQQTGKALHHVAQFSFDPQLLPGNIEHFIGVAQVPIGLAGPLLVNGECAKGEFYVPLATTEGTLVASYNRGMKLIRESGGVLTTVSDDAMQRAPVFIFKSAREAREFGVWVEENFAEIKRRADQTTRVGRLRDIEQYSASHYRFLRFNYTTGDAAGQNMVSKATKAACDWICSVYPEVENYYLESNFATDKKSSFINQLRTRGKRVTGVGMGVPGPLRRDTDHAHERQRHTPRAAGDQSRQLDVGRQQQRQSFGQRHRRAVHRYRPGRRQRRRVVGGHHPRRDDTARRFLLFSDDPIADRGDLWRRHGIADAARVFGAARLLRSGRRPQVR